MDEARQDTLSLIKRRLASMTAGEKRIAGFILSEPQRTVGMTMKSLAGEVGVSEGSVANFAARLGYDGYTALKIALLLTIHLCHPPALHPRQQGQRGYDEERKISKIGAIHRARSSIYTKVGIKSARTTELTLVNIS